MIKIKGFGTHIKHIHQMNIDNYYKLHEKERYIKNKNHKENIKLFGITCLICKRKFLSLAYHLTTHNITSREYKIKFGEDSILSEYLRNKISNTIQCKWDDIHSIYHTDEYKTKNIFFKDKHGINNPFYGKKHTDKTKKIISLHHIDISGDKNPMYDIRQFGDKNPNWKGGKSTSFSYGIEFNNDLKKRIKERDLHRCFLCDTPYELCVHHIDYNKGNSSPTNLITLCRRDNNLVNIHRGLWEEYFKIINNRQESLKFLESHYINKLSKQTYQFFMGIDYYESTIFLEDMHNGKLQQELEQ